MKAMKPMYVVGIAVVAIALGFFGGMQYQKRQVRTTFANGVPGGNGQFFRQAGGRQGGQNVRFGGGNRPVMGEIVNQDEKSMTVKLPDGSTKIVILSATTSYNKAEPGSQTDLKVGDSVGVFGTTNSDGSVTAMNVQINPMMRGMQASPSAMPK